MSRIKKKQLAKNVLVEKHNALIDIYKKKIPQKYGVPHYKNSTLVKNKNKYLKVVETTTS